LQTISIFPIPVKLKYLDISYNNFTQLPSFTGCCQSLHTIEAHHNQLYTLAEFLSVYKITALRILNLSHNNIRFLSRLPEKMSTIEQCLLQSNELQTLPENFFAITQKHLRILNASCNKLGMNLHFEQNEVLRSQLEEVYISNNSFNETILNVLVNAKKLRVLHAAYNKISELPAVCLRNWAELEILVLSGNLLQNLPEIISTLTKLKVLRVHSNLLLSTPTFSKLSSLQVLDLAHNHLDRINLLSIVPKNLKYLDLSCNLQLQVDEQQVKVCQSQKHWSLVDVSGKNRLCLPTTKLEYYMDNNMLKPPWSLGFSETPGNVKRLLVSQLRLCNFNKDEGLFGIIESDVSSAVANSVAQTVPKIIDQERAVKEAINVYMKFTLLTALQKLNKSGELGNIGITICHISRENVKGVRDYVRPNKTKKYILRVASVGNIGAYLVRKTTNVCLTNMTESPAEFEQTNLLMNVPKLNNNNSNNNNNNNKNNYHYQKNSNKLLHNLPDPKITEVPLSNEDEYLVICNGNTWAKMDINRVAREIRKEENILLAAKRVQDIAQSFGANANLSVIVLRFRNIGTDVDYLIKELKQTVRKKPISTIAAAAALLPNVCKRTCCERNNICRHRIIERPATRSERSSPSGQSDQVLSPINKGEDYILAHAHVLEEENEMEVLDETDSVLSEEQFKCWEYMLEQNTQLLFDKELNTISKSLTKNQTNERKSNLMNNVKSKFISTSSPQLINSEVKKRSVSPGQLHQEQQSQQQNQQQQMSFLSKHFGSSRSFQAVTSSVAYNFFESKSRNSVTASPYTKINGCGPHAAYFGSLQRLMPYNLEYDFAVTQERSALNEDNDEDYNVHDSRMRKYWGVATTEL
ncbi:protein phosphatase PHLPP-like protein, partial [Teleopsis dalmanni]|uniref:protein phosphatase PHLPP-like protein n=2 Tax=Teleopsis dalmanni TaxID=139649 RepID=UPI0018CF8570